MKKMSKTRFWKLYHAGMFIFSILAAIITRYTQTGRVTFAETLVPFGSIFVMCILIGYLAIYMVNRAAKLSHEQVMKWIVPGLLIFFAGAFLIANLSVSLGVLAWFIATGKDLDTYFAQLFQHELNFASSRLILWFLFLSIAFFYVLWRKSAKKEQQLHEEMLRFRYQTLKSQVNPHFLFNSLNTLSELVYKGPEKAERYIQELSGIYRYIIDNEETRMVTVDKEIEFVKRFFQLQEVRDEEKILLNIDVPEMDNFYIVPVSLQLLVENAIKHNTRSIKSPLTIDILRKDDFISVSNRIQRKNTLENSTGKGLKNLQERVRLITGKEITIEETADRYTVRIPIIPL